MVFQALDRRCDGHRGLPHAVLTSESVRHVSFLPKQLVDLIVKIMVKTRIPLCAREIRKRCEELACPAEDDEQVDERVDEPVDVEDGEQVEFQEEEQPEQDLHAAEIMLRRVHANLGHPGKGLMLRLLRDANVPPKMITAARNFHCPHCDLMATAAQTAFVRADARKTLRMAQYARSRELRNPMVGQLVRYFRRSKGGVGGGRDRGLGGKMTANGGGVTSRISCVAGT